MQGLRCAKCGDKNPVYINRKTGDNFCKRCFDEKNTCIKCKKIHLGGIFVKSDYYCLDCYLKEGWGIKRRRPTTEKDKALIEKLSKPIWEQ